MEKVSLGTIADERLSTTARIGVGIAGYYIPPLRLSIARNGSQQLSPRRVLLPTAGVIGAALKRV